MTALEILMGQVRTAADRGDQTFELWVPDALTFGGAPVADNPMGMAMALLTDTALGCGFVPAGVIVGESGHTCRYRRE